jgi:hypothetical protein
MDESLSAGGTVRAVHLMELRAAIDARRAMAQLAAYAWAGPVIVPRVTVVRAQHLVDLRAALADVYVAHGRTPPNYTDPDVALGLPIKAVDIGELRAAVLALP